MMRYTYARNKVQCISEPRAVARTPRSLRTVRQRSLFWPFSGLLQRSDTMTTIRQDHKEADGRLVGGTRVGAARPRREGRAPEGGQHGKPAEAGWGSKTMREDGGGADHG